MINARITRFIHLSVAGAWAAAVLCGSVDSAFADTAHNCRAQSVHASWLKAINAKIAKAKQNNPNIDVSGYFQKRDREVVRHEQAHLAAACEWGLSIHYLKTRYKGQVYRTAGCTRVRGDAPWQIAYLSALAPLAEGIEPSPYDRRIAEATSRLLRSKRDPWQQVGLCPAAAKVKAYLEHRGDGAVKVPPGKIPKSGPRIIYGN
ncbi:hypothetical protein V5T82_14575 [Magnetovibrio sp. PR-2]|uniref:hypothetical protein n=1 Tax=Magnetovibrio sp. PR-2 TaxID=3120356 RepID=UPI002FCE43BE